MQPLPAAGGVYGRYFLVSKIAEGGMAEIFLAKHRGAEGFERNVVIKRMLPHLSSNPEFVGMFLDEAKLAARLNHPNVVQINDLGLADGCYFICMEYLPGEDFSSVLRTSARKRQYVPMAIALRVIAEAAMGLHFAHEFCDEHGEPLNIVHRDVSPSNLYVTYQGQVKVLDFGIAKAESRVTQTTAGVVKGKYMYMAPEQAGSGNVDRRADVFSLGVSLYEAVTLTRPFARDSELAILNAVLKHEFQAPRKVRSDLPQEVEAIILKAMAQKPEDRYQTAAQMAADLTRYLANNTTAGTALGDYLVSLFGNERRLERTRIPTLSSLAPGGLPGLAQHMAVSFSRSDTPTLAVRVPVAPPSTPTVRALTQPDEASRRSPLWRGGAAALLLIIGVAAAAAGGSYAVLRTLRPASVVTALPPAVAVAGAVVASPRPGPGPADLTKPSPAPSPVSGVPGPDTGVPASHKEPHPKPAPARPVQLGVDDIRAVISHGASGITRCFQLFGSDLPSDQGEASVRFTISSAGKVTEAATQGALAQTGAGRCLEAQVMKLHFPVNTDRGITLTQPFVYHRVGK